MYKTVSEYIDYLRNKIKDGLTLLPIERTIWETPTAYLPLPEHLLSRILLDIWKRQDFFINAYHTSNLKAEAPIENIFLLNVGTPNVIALDEESINAVVLFIDGLASTWDTTRLHDFIRNHANTNTEITEEDAAYLKRIGIESVLPLENLGRINNDTTARFSSALWYEAITEKVVTLAGLGGIGSWIALLLSRMRPKALYLYDNDIVEEVNMAGQLYGIKDVGEYKADAITYAIKNYSDYGDVFAICERFTNESPASHIMICGFDNMEARKTYFESWLNLVHQLDKEERANCLFIDGRLAAEDFQVYACTGDNDESITKYQETLFSDDEADATVCSYKQTTYMANMIGSVIVNLFTNFVANNLVGNLIRELPFKTTYNGSIMKFKIE
jgi:molybdopterin/thiamine biosynthesis adenylyltransferase